ncbi:MAG TPA: Fic family protein [Candidatus Paceibacterota bacterium]
MPYLEKNIRKRLESKLEPINRSRPLSPAVVAKLRERFAMEMTYNSNAIEGSRLSLKETYFVISQGITIKGKSLKDHLEAKDHYDALNYLYDLVEHGKKHTFSEVLIRSLQQLIVRETEPSSAGAYRRGNVGITGSTHKPPEAHNVPRLMRELVEWVIDKTKNLHPVELAAITHHKLVSIHPFDDGNGRTARLLMNLVLMQAGYPLAIILKTDRKRYYDALERADRGDYKSFVRFVAQAVERSLTLYLEAIGQVRSKGNRYLPFSTISPQTPYSGKYLNLLARAGKIDAHKEGRIWVTTLDAILNYRNERERKRK